MWFAGSPQYLYNIFTVIIEMIYGCQIVVAFLEKNSHSKRMIKSKQNHND